MNRSRSLKCIVFFIGLTVGMLLASSAIAQFESSARFVPESANALVMVRAKEIMNSEISKKEHWRSDRIKRFNSGATFLPPATKQLLLAAQLDFEYMEPIWQVAVFEKSGGVDMLKVSERIGGNLEKIGKKDAIVLPNDAYLVKIDDDTLTSMSPANRQVTSRWIRDSQFGTIKLSNYLTSALSFAEHNASVVVAFDFEDVLHPEDIKKRVKDSGICKDDQLDAVCKTLSSLRGLTLGITINDKVTGAIKIDFGSSPASLRPLAKDLLVHALKKNGMMIKDFADWDMNIKGNQLRMGGPLSSMGLRQIGSLIEHPLVSDFESDYNEGQADMKTCSLQYWGSVQKLIEELQDKDATTYNKYFEKYARHIDRLSVLNVDPVVLSYGTYVADSFSGISGGLQSQNLKKVRDRSTYESGSADYHGRGDYTNWNGYTSRAGWGGGGYRSNARNRQRVSGQSRLEGNIGANNILREVEQATAKVRSQMSQKYKVDF